MWPLGPEGLTPYPHPLRFFRFLETHLSDAVGPIGHIGPLGRRLTPLCRTVCLTPRRGAPVSPESPVSPEPGRVRLWRTNSQSVACEARHAPQTPGRTCALRARTARPPVLPSLCVFVVLCGLSRGRFGPLGLHGNSRVASGFIAAKGGGSGFNLRCSSKLPWSVLRALVRRPPLCPSVFSVSSVFVGICGFPILAVFVFLRGSSWTS